MVFHWISETLFDEPEYTKPEHLAVVAFILTHRDMAGVVEVSDRVGAGKCRMSRGKYNRVLDYFEQCGKLIFGEKRVKFWWKSGIFHSLNRGKFSENQLKSVQNLIVKHQKSGVFGQNFAELVSQLYENKYSLSIPIPKDLEQFSGLQSESESDTESETDTEASSCARAREEQTECREDSDSTIRVPEADVLKLYEFVKYKQTDWQHTVQVRGMDWCRRLCGRFGFDLVTQTLAKLQKHYATKPELTVPGTVDYARQKQWEWCEREEQGRGRGKKSIDDITEQYAQEIADGKR